MDYTCCTLCPRACGVDRTTGERGFCGASDQMQVAKIMCHQWEEPVICSGAGAGAVFFGGCTLKCIYCQNDTISQTPMGKEMTAQQLRSALEELVSKGCSCIDLVTPTQYLPSILPALTPKLPVPVVYNCGGYESVQTLRQLEGLVDIYLPDLKYADNALGANYSQAPDYWETAKAAILEMFRQTGPVQLENGRMKKGVIVRHLVLPGQVGNSLDVLDWISETFRPGEILLSVMSQYTPTAAVPPVDCLQRTVTEEEYDGVLSYLELLGLEDGFVQELDSAQQAYIPQWDV